jgi:hypothetical protein
MINTILVQLQAKLWSLITVKSDRAICFLAAKFSKNKKSLEGQKEEENFNL